MARMSTPLTLPSKIRQWLEAKLIDTNFSNYRLLSAELKAKGYDVSKSALHRYGKVLKDKLLAQPSRPGNDLTANALCILAAAVSHPKNVTETAKAYMGLARNEVETGG